LAQPTDIHWAPPAADQPLAGHLRLPLPWHEQHAPRHCATRRSASAGAASATTRPATSSTSIPDESAAG